MRVDFDLSSLSEGILAEHMQAMAAMQSAFPVLASQVDQWLTKETERRRRKKTARGQAMVLPLLCEKELECGLVVHVRA